MGQQKDATSFDEKMDKFQEDYLSVTGRHLSDAGADRYAIYLQTGDAEKKGSGRTGLRNLDLEKQQAKYQVKG